MKRGLTVLLLAILALASVVVAQDNPFPNPTPAFTVLPQHPQAEESGSPAAQVTQWNGSFTDLTKVKRTFTMIGTDPSKTNSTTTVKVLVIPIKMVFPNQGNKTFDPAKHKLSNGQTIVQNIVTSPLFKAGIDFKQGATDLGNTQYIDAFQRGTWWGIYVKKHPKYHVLLKPTVAPEQTINCNNSSCTVGSEFGVVVGLEDINDYDNSLQGFMKSLKVTPDILPLFVIYDTYLTSGGCCIGGYHSANGGQPGGQTYATATYVDKVGAFSQDVSAFSHEIGEWMDDPFVDNRVGCSDNSILEVGDPLEGERNYGGYPYKLQDRKSVV